SLSESADGHDWTFPAVIKPRHGAGSTNTFLVRDRASLQAFFERPLDPPDLPPDILQPYIRGRALSVSAVVSTSSGNLNGDEARHAIELFPIGEQRLSNDGKFGYLGGTIPAPEVPVEAVHRLVTQACAGLEGGLRGYVGFDVLLPEDSEEPL